VVDPLLPLRAGLAVADLAGPGALVKWPNDVLVDGRKVAGILAEARNGRVVLGIGINVNIGADELPGETETPAGSLSLAAGRELSRAELLAEVLLLLEQRYDAWALSGG
jgi:BirA family transcriptional regulator, biotin operon repressor / biotin---[acetyl-CoA-carboxylase] ligase